MSAILLVPPSAEPWPVAEAKAFLRVEHDDDDAVIAALIAAARGHVEALSRRALLVQRWRFVLDAWPPGGRFDPRMGPLRSVIAARVFDAAGNARGIDVATFVVDAAATIIASPCWTLPRPGRVAAGIELDVELGYGALAADVPDALRHAIRMLVAHWYENRGLAAIGGNVAMLPAGVGALVAPYRMLSL
ncbi:head-tail connector protein [uncultured Bradyrhizobium sp.]|uniref:head-tail connector protein n=1 Tax=uncultured Bradyrhizobium sp. TaxID=199684 RepID=UPI0035C97FDD